MAARKRPKKPKGKTRKRQDPSHTEADFLRDLEQASTNEAKRLSGRPSARGRGSN
jgi:hypothetical protein